MKQDEIELLQKTALFAGIDPAGIAALTVEMGGRQMTYKKGSFILHAGESHVPTVLVLTGSVYVIREDFWGNRTILTKVEQGDLFGETYSCLEEEPLGVSASAAEDCRCLLLYPQRIMQKGINEENSQFALNLIRIFAAKNLLLTGKIDCLSQRSIRQKLLTCLSLQSRRAGSDRFTLPFNRQQLADYLAVDRSAMSSILGKLKQEGVLDYHRNQIHLLDPAASVPKKVKSR